MLGPAQPERTTLDDLNQLVTPSIGAIIFALGVVVVGLVVIVLVLIRRVSKLDGRIANLTAGGDGTSLESTLEAHIDKVYAVAREVDELEVRTAVLERLQPDAFQRLGLVRYNPFEDTGGNQSFALALLDQHGDGFIVSSLHTRTATRVYGKAITGGKADGGTVGRGGRGPSDRPGVRDRVPRRPDRHATRDTGAGTGSPQPRVMPPDARRAAAPPAVPVARPRPVRRVRRRAGRGEPEPLVQIPVWGAIEPPVEEGPAPAGTDQLLEGLNAEQRKAVMHGDGPLLVVAGAGTGKTSVITRRIAWLIATKRARPSEILALTFTDQAADEMQVRVDQLVPYGYTDTAISTFHAFGDRLIREFALELGLPSDVRVFSRPETVVFLREHVFELELDEYRPLGDPTKFLDALATLFSRAKDEDVSPEAFLAHAEGLAAQAAAAAQATVAAEATGVDRAAEATGARPTRPPRSPRRRASAASSPGRTACTRGCWRRTARSTSATRSRSRCGSCASPRPRGSRSRSGSSTCSWTSSRTRTGPRRSSSRSSPSATAT